MQRFTLENLLQFERERGKDQRDNRARLTFQMGRKPCCSKEGLNRGAWNPVDDQFLVDYNNACLFAFKGHVFKEYI